MLGIRGNNKVMAMLLTYIIFQRFKDYEISIELSSVL